MRILVAYASRTRTVVAGAVVAGALVACARTTVPNRVVSAGSASHVFTPQFDYLWTQYQQLYPSFTYKAVDWKAQRAIYRPRAQNARSQDEFVAVVREMLAPLHDLHAFLIDPRGDIVSTYQPSGIANFDRLRWGRALRDASYVSRSTGVGEAMVGSYPYLFIGSWNAPLDITGLDLALARARDAAGLIIDVRTNGGGNDATALALVARFATRSFVASYVQMRNGSSSGDLDTPVARTVTPRGAWQFTRPVVVIAGRAGFSATESFVAAMRTLPNVTVIGDTTGGASGNPATFALENGWQFSVPRWLEYGPDRKPIEGRGVPPHLTLAWNPDMYDSERDPLIDAAVGVLGERTGVYRMAPASTNNVARTSAFARNAILAARTAHYALRSEKK